MTSLDTGETLAPHVLPQGTDAVDEALRTMRRVLDMDAAILSEFSGEDYVVRAIDAPAMGGAISPGDRVPLDITYCRSVIEGDLPQVIPDSKDIPHAAALPITDMFGIRSYVGVPIRREDGGIYGMFCCISGTPNPTLNQRDLEVMRIFADLSAREVNSALVQRARLDRITERLDRAIGPQGHDIHFQPIQHLDKGTVLACEALCRFQIEPSVPPDRLFDEASGVGRGLELERAVLTTALGALDRLPPEVNLTLNVGPQAVVDGVLQEVLAGRKLERVIVEITEHVSISDYVRLDEVFTDIRARGAWLAVDDAGAGYAGLRHILQLRPDFIKLDMTLTRNIDTDKARRSLAVAMLHYASETGAELVAEGIETAEELDMLRTLGVPYGQGYHLGRPAALDEILPRLNEVQAMRATASG